MRSRMVRLALAGCVGFAVFALATDRTWAKRAETVIYAGTGFLIGRRVRA